MKFQIKPAALIVVILMLFAFSACEAGGTGDSGPTTYAIGDTGPSGVGIVFYITDGGLHGLEAAPSDQMPMAWSNVYDSDSGAIGSAIGTGSENTDLIIKQTGHLNSAAYICRSYNGGGLADWFLPSLYELDELYLQRNIVGGFSSGSYWSSTDDGQGYAREIGFPDGDKDYNDKEYFFRVRAVRKF